MGPEHIESVTAASAAITLWRRLSRGWWDHHTTRDLR